MSASMKNILVIGGTSGIGEAFAKRWHSQGKKVIVTGRRQQKLDELEASLPGLKGYAFDLTKFEQLPHHVDALFKTYPGIDTVWINSGKGSMFSFKDPSTSTDAHIIDEINTNITGPTILTRHIIPHLLAKSTPTQLLITGSGMGFIPNGRFAIYSPTKAFIHHFMVGLRQTLQGSNVHVIELVPPFVQTDMHTDYKDLLKGVPALSLQEFTDEVFGILDGAKAEELKEVAAGSAKGRVESWRGAIGAILEGQGIWG